MTKLRYERPQLLKMNAGLSFKQRLSMSHEWS